MTVGEALAEAGRRLAAAGIEGGAGDARRLMAHALGIDASRVTLHLGDTLGNLDRFFDLIARRARHEPVSKITGRRAFWGRDFAVTPDVLDPRPETELIVELALEMPFAHVLDLGTGSGCILLSLLADRPAAWGQGTDISPAALEVARTNAARLGVSDRARFRLGPWYQAAEGRFDLIVSNPPYIAASEMPGLAPEVRNWDPDGALTDHADGLSAYRAILDGYGPHLAPEGRLIVETGWRQGPAVAAMFRAAGLEDIRIHADLEGRDRVISGKCPPNRGEMPQFA